MVLDNGGKGSKRGNRAQEAKEGKRTIEAREAIKAVKAWARPALHRSSHQASTSPQPEGGR
jgi:hypothetical protein